MPGSWTHTLPFGGYDDSPNGRHHRLGLYHKRWNIAHNDDLGLIDMNARYYDPFVRRFVSADVIVPDSEDPQTFNRYSYVHNSPLQYIDPMGHRECEFDDYCGLLPHLPKSSTASNSRELEDWELHALMQAVYSETQNGSYSREHLEFLAWAYLNRISSGEWSDMGAAVYSEPPIGYVNGVPIFLGSPQSSAGVLWHEVQDTWSLEDVPDLVEERWKYNSNPNWDEVEKAVNFVYANWLENGAGSANDSTHGGYYYAALVRADENNGGMSRSEFDALLMLDFVHSDRITHGFDQTSKN